MSLHLDMAALLQKAQHAQCTFRHGRAWYWMRNCVLRRTSMKSWYALDTSSISTVAAFRRVATSEAAVMRWMA